MEPYAIEYNYLIILRGLFSYCVQTLHLIISELLLLSLRFLFSLSPYFGVNTNPHLLFSSVIILLFTYYLIQTTLFSTLLAPSTSFLSLFFYFSTTYFGNINLLNIFPSVKL